MFFSPTLSNGAGTPRESCRGGAGGRCVGGTIRGVVVLERRGRGANKAPVKLASAEKEKKLASDDDPAFDEDGCASSAVDNVALAGVGTVTVVESGGDLCVK